MRRKLERRRSRSADSLRRMITESKQDVLHGGEVRQIPGFDGETDFAVVQRKSEGDDLNQLRRMSGSDMRGRGSNGHRRQVSEGGRLEGGGGGGGGEGGEEGRRGGARRGGGPRKEGTVDAIGGGRPWPREEDVCVSRQ